MAQYIVTYKCGHMGMVELFGRGSDRKYRLRKLAEGNCPDCEKEALRLKIVEFEKERELPGLSGTILQAEWAQKLRYYSIRAVEEDYERRGEKDPDKEPISRVLQEMYTIREANVWISMKDMGLYKTYEFIVKRIRNREGVQEKKAEPEFIASPEECRHDGIARIRINGNYISFHYPKNDSFIDVMHEKFCRWKNGEWTKKASDLSGTAEDIAADIGNALLLKGFTVSFPSGEIKDMAVNGTFEKTRTRWIVPYDDKRVCIEWLGRDEELYSAARMIKSSRYVSQSVTVLPEYFNDIEDFAEQYGFFIAPGARKMLDTARAKITEAVVDVKAPAESTPDAISTEDLLAELTEED